MKKAIDKFTPAWWLPNSHLQTLFPFWYIKNKEFPHRLERFELPDGDFIDSIWTDKPAAPTVVILHGLQGSIHSPHVNSLMHKIHHTTNWNAVALSFRGCSSDKQRVFKQYHGGDTEDIKFILNLIKQRNPKQPLSIVGFSLGGNILLKLFGELKHNNLLETGVAVSPPFDLKASAEHMQKGWSSLYNQMFLSDIKQAILNKFPHNSSKDQIQSQLDEINTLIELDEKITAPKFGFSSVDEYYYDSSCGNYLQYIKKPTLIIIAKNDPIIDYSNLPIVSPCTQIEAYAEGGHLGFISGSIHNPCLWSESRVMSHLAEYMPLGVHEIE